MNQLYEALNVEEHQLNKERDLCGQLEELKVELEPLEQVSNNICYNYNDKYLHNNLLGRCSALNNNNMDSSTR